jgi:hypothetical protein
MWQHAGVALFRRGRGSTADALCREASSLMSPSPSGERTVMPLSGGHEGKPARFASLPSSPIEQVSESQSSERESKTDHLVQISPLPTGSRVASIRARPWETRPWGRGQPRRGLAVETSEPTPVPPPPPAPRNYVYPAVLALTAATVAFVMMTCVARACVNVCACWMVGVRLCLRQAGRVGAPPQGLGDINLYTSDGTSKMGS